MAITGSEEGVGGGVGVLNEEVRPEGKKVILQILLVQGAVFTPDGFWSTNARMCCDPFVRSQATRGERKLSFNWILGLSKRKAETCSDCYRCHFLFRTPDTYFTLL